MMWRLTTLGLLLAGSASWFIPSELPPLSDPPSGKVLAGKFVWADLVTDDVAAVRTFHASLFDLGWLEVSAPPEEYGLLTLDGRPVAGVAYLESPDKQSPYGRWVHYLSVDDVARAEREVERRGGRTVLSRRSFAQRGEFAVVMGADQALVGLLRSSSGDPDDYRAEPGEWLWRELFSAQPTASAELYRALCGCEVAERDDEEGGYLISSQGYLRANITPLKGIEDGSPGWLGYVQVDDVAATVAKAVELGGGVVFAPTPDVFDGHLAIISDPAGAYLGLIRWDYDVDDTEAGR